MRRRLLWHPESDSYIIDDESAIEAEPLLVDVTDNDDHEMNAAIQGHDINTLTREEYESDDFWDLPSIGHNGGPALDNAGGVSGAIATSMRKWARKAADLYPTPPDCVYSLIPHIEDILPAGSRILEPACADGQLSKALEEFGYEVSSYDLRPDVKYGTGGVDFLDPDTEWEADYFDAVWTNPPFVCAAEFILKSLEIAPVVVMLLKAQYWNTANRKKLFRETKPYREFRLTWRPAFLEKERGKSPLMDCIWVVWKAGHTGLPTVDILDRRMSCPMPQDSFGGL